MLVQKNNTVKILDQNNMQCNMNLKFIPVNP